MGCAESEKSAIVLLANGSAVRQKSFCIIAGQVARLILFDACMFSSLSV
jgi:hypothetical protein